MKKKARVKAALQRSSEPGSVPPDELNHIFDAVGLKSYMVLGAVCRHWTTTLKARLSDKIVSTGKRRRSSPRFTNTKTLIGAHGSVKKDSKLWPFMTTYKVATESISLYRLALTQPDFNSTNKAIGLIASAMGKNGNLEVVESHMGLLREQKVSSSIIDGVLKSIVRTATGCGRINILKWFLEKQSADDRNKSFVQSLFVIAAQAGQAGSFKWLTDMPERIHEKQPLKSKLMYAMAAHGQHELLSSFFDDNFPGIHPLHVANMKECVHAAITSGSIHTIKFLITSRNNKPIPNGLIIMVVVGAVYSEQKHVIEWLKESVPEFDYDMIFQYVKQYLADKPSVESEALKLIRGNSTFVWKALMDHISLSAAPIHM